jgi:hypothetical protein
MHNREQFDSLATKHRMLNNICRAQDIKEDTLEDTFLIHVFFSCCAVIVNISVEIKLSNKTFNEELKNESSPAYIELKNDVYVEVF